MTLTWVSPDSPTTGLVNCHQCGRETYVVLRLEDASHCCRWCFRRHRREARQALAKALPQL